MAEKKKPKPGPSTGGSSKSSVKRPKGSQPLTLGTGGLRTGKVSKKQQAGTRKVVGALAATLVPAVRGAKLARASMPKRPPEPKGGWNKQAMENAIKRDYANKAAATSKYGKVLTPKQIDKVVSVKATAKKPTRTKPNPYNKAKDEVLSLDSVVRSNRRGSAGQLDKRFQILSTPTKKKNIRAYKASQKKK
jgi:hypothetical protein